MGSDDVKPKRGRPYGRYTLADTVPPKTSRADSRKCGECPRNQGGTWCSIAARYVSATQPACTYGKMLIRAETIALRRNPSIRHDGDLI